MEEILPPPIPPLQPPLKPTTTAEQDLGTKSQRHINRIWERTQQIIAILVTLSALYLCGWVLVYGQDLSLRQSSFIFVTNIAFIVVSLYFQRTNHIKVGGVAQGGPEIDKDLKEYR